MGIMSPYAPLSARFLAFLVDTGFLYASVLSGSFFGGFVATLMTGQGATRQAAEDALASGMLLGCFFWGAVAWMMNYGILQGMTGRSIGKYFFRLRVVSKDGAPIGVGVSIFRTLCYAFSFVPFCIGALAVFWHKEGRCWHDSMCGTIVLRRGARYPLPVARAAPAVESAAVKTAA